VRGSRQSGRGAANRLNAVRLQGAQRAGARRTGKRIGGNAHFVSSVRVCHSFPIGTRSLLELVPIGNSPRLELVPDWNSFPIGTRSRLELVPIDWNSFRLELDGAGQCVYSRDRDSSPVGCRPSALRQRTEKRTPIKVNRTEVAGRPAWLVASACRESRGRRALRLP
jgi:hypothetical protein